MRQYLTQQHRVKNTHPKGLFIPYMWMAKAGWLHWETYAATYSQGVEERIQLLSVDQAVRCQRRPISASAIQ